MVMFNFGVEHCHFLSSKLTEKIHTHLTEKLFYPQSTSSFPLFSTIPENPSRNIFLKYSNSPASLTITISAPPSNSKRKPTQNGFHSKIRPFPNLPLIQAVLASISRFSPFFILLPIPPFISSTLPQKTQSTTKLPKWTHFYRTNL